MASAPSSTSTVKTVNNKTGVTTSTSTVKSGGSTTTTKTTTIGKAKSTTAAKSTSTPSTLAAATLGGTWISGPNDSRQLCAPVAVANALLGATGAEASNAAIERLYREAGGIGDSGVPVPSVLAAARRYGLAGERLKTSRAAALDDADIVLLEFASMPGIWHAAAFAGMSVITWGAEIPLGELDATIHAAWSLTWHGQKEPAYG